MDSYNSPTTKPIYHGTNIVWYLVGILEVLLAFRFFLKLLAANSSAGFTDFVYRLSNIFVAPFLNVFRISRVDKNVFEWTTLLAMAVYWLIGLAIIRLFFMGRSVSTPEAAAKLDDQNK